MAPPGGLNVGPGPDLALAMDATPLLSYVVLRTRRAVVVQGASKQIT